MALCVLQTPHLHLRSHLNSPFALREAAALSEELGAPLTAYTLPRARALFIARRRLTEPRQELGCYLDVDRCVDGFFQLAGRLLGVEVTEVSMPPEEGWAPAGQLRKLLVRQRGQDRGVIYLDLWARPRKHRVPNVQVLHCSRVASWRPGMTRQALARC